MLAIVHSQRPRIWGNIVEKRQQRSEQSLPRPRTLGEKEGQNVPTSFRKETPTNLDDLHPTTVKAGINRLPHKGRG